MKTARLSTRQQRLWRAVALLTVLALFLFLSALLAQAQEVPPPVDGGEVQILSGSIELGTEAFYLLPGLKEGDQLYVYATGGEAGNLDAFLGLSAAPYTADELQTSISASVGQMREQGLDPLEFLPIVYSSHFVAWDDDSGPGYDAVFEYAIPGDGDYQLMVSNSPPTRTFGDYRVLVGLGAEDVMSGEAEPTGAELAFFDEDANRAKIQVQEITGTLTAETPEVVLILEPWVLGDTFYAFVEATSGDLKPIMVLRDHGEKRLRSGNASGEETLAALDYEVEEPGRTHTLQIRADGTEGDYRLLVGVNSPEVLTGGAETRGRAVLKAPIVARVAVKLEQITNVDQVGENFGAVASMQMAWQDPNLAFNPDECGCSSKTFTGEGFAKFVEENEIKWPRFTFLNQQGNRWAQNQNVTLRPDGRAYYFERFTTDFQAPLFDFTRFPFDTQELYIHLRCQPKEDLFTLRVMKEVSHTGELLGEEEWYVTDSSSTVESDGTRSSYWLTFEVQRHLTFYWFRIIIPIIVIIIVAWFTFFLKDYGKRVDVSGANLLVFVAFNFTVSGELPRLGYLTFLDVVLAGTFVISALVVAFNVFLKRLELTEHRDLAERIDKYAIWVYPLAYGMGAILAYLLFLT